MVHSLLTRQTHCHDKLIITVSSALVKVVLPTRLFTIYSANQYGFSYIIIDTDTEPDID